MQHLVAKQPDEVGGFAAQQDRGHFWQRLWELTILFPAFHLLLEPIVKDLE